MPTLSPYEMMPPLPGAAPPESPSTVTVNVFIPYTGPLGLTIEQLTDDSCRVKSVGAGTQAEAAGVQEGDVPVWAGEKISYDDFLEMCKHGPRPVAFNVLRDVNAANGAVHHSASANDECKGAPEATGNENAPNGRSTAVVTAKKDAGNAPRVSLSPMAGSVKSNDTSDVSPIKSSETKGIGAVVAAEDPAAAVEAVLMAPVAMHVVPIFINEEGPIGATLVQMSGNLAMVKAVNPGSNAEKAGLMAGDLPLLLGQRVGYAEFIQLCKTKPLSFQVLRGGPYRAAPVVAPAAALQDPAPAVVAPAAASAPVPSGQELDTLLAMTASELRAELKARGITMDEEGATKDSVLEKLGVPTSQWHVWRKMKIAEMKQELKNQGKKISGNKDELLQRLGVPEGFGLTSEEKALKASKKRAREEKKKERQAEKKKKAEEAAEEASEDWDYCVCCDKQDFGAQNNDRPAGCISFPDGSMMEVWRCVSCGEIPRYPNAPPVTVFSSDEEEEEEEESADEEERARAFLMNYALLNGGPFAGAGW